MYTRYAHERGNQGVYICTPARRAHDPQSSETRLRMSQGGPACKKGTRGLTQRQTHPDGLAYVSFCTEMPGHGQDLRPPKSCPHGPQPASPRASRAPAPSLFEATNGPNTNLECGSSHPGGRRLVRTPPQHVKSSGAFSTRGTSYFHTEALDSRMDPELFCAKLPCLRFRSQSRSIILTPLLRTPLRHPLCLPKRLQPRDPCARN